MRCIVRANQLEPEDRPRRLPAEGGHRARVRALGNAAGLSRMGVSLREIPPGFFGTHRHWHSVEEEWVFVLAGEGFVRLGAQRLAVRPGTFVGFPPGPVAHHFRAEGASPLVLLEGGERRPDEDVVAYPDLGKALRSGRLEPLDALEEAGKPGRCIALEDVPARDFQHDVDPRARRQDLRSLHAATGLERQAVRWSRVRPGDSSTAYHTHDRTDEWVYVLDGRAAVRIGDDRFEVGPGDFVGHPAGSAPHAMEPESELTYLMGGQIDPTDVVLYPEAGVRRVGGHLEPIPDAP